MISHACYVKCDGCGSPAQIAALAGTAKEARSIAAGEGFKRTKNQDLCPVCAMQDADHIAKKRRQKHPPRKPPKRDPIKREAGWDGPR